MTRQELFEWVKEEYGTEPEYLWATPLMFLSFHMVYLMQAIQRGRTSLLLAFVRQIVLNIPVMITLDSFFGMNGMIWSQVLADTVTVLFSYWIYYKVRAASGN